MMNGPSEESGGFHNNSGEGVSAVMPPQAAGLNWGAFFLGWIWGLGNNSYIAFLTMVPLLGFFMSVYLLFQGNSLAWKNKKWQTVAQFHRNQKMWAMFGLGCLCVPAVALVCMLVVVGGLTFIMLGDSAPVQMALSCAQHNPEVVAAIGEPIKKEWYLTGGIEEQNGTSRVDLSIPMTGSKGSGTARLNGTYSGGNWDLKTFEFEVGKTHENIPLRLSDNK